MKVELTEAFVANQLICPPDRRKAEYVHACSGIGNGIGAETRGLYVEVARGTPGVGVYRFRYKCPTTKKTKHIRIGSTTEVTLLAAFEQAKLYRQRLNAGLEAVVEETPLVEIPTFHDFVVDTYIPMVKHRKRSWQRDLDIVRLRLSDIADTRLDKITRLQLMTLHNKLKESGLAEATCNHGLKVARQVLGLAVSLEVLERNVAAGIPLFPENNTRDRFLNPEELARLLNVLKTDKNRNVCRIALWLLATGCRYQEALQSQWDQLDLENRSWRIPSQSTKTNRSRSVPVNDLAMEVISELNTKDKYAYLFINPKTQKPYANIHKVWDRLRADAGVKTCRIHDLRHIFGATLASEGQSLWVISKLLGHSSQSRSTERYSGVHNSALMNASNSAAKIIQEAMKKTA